MNEKEEKLIGEITKKDETTVIRFAVKEFRNREYFDIRIYFKNGKGHLFPTQKGITLSRKSLPLAINFCQQAVAALDGEEPF